MAGTKDIRQVVYLPKDTGINGTDISAATDSNYVGIRGMNQITIFMDYTYGAGGTTTVSFTLDYKYDTGGGAQSTNSYDLQHLEDAGSGTLTSYVRKIQTPTGTSSWNYAWHIPVNADWVALTNITGGTSDTATVIIKAAAL